MQGLVCKAEISLLFFPLLTVRLAILAYDRFVNYLFEGNIQVSELVSQRHGSSSECVKTDNRLVLVDFHHGDDWLHVVPQLSPVHVFIPFCQFLEKLSECHQCVD